MELNLTHDELQLVCIYNQDTKTDTIKAIIEMKEYIAPDETELLSITESVLHKLRRLSEEDFRNLDLIPDFDI